MTLPAIVAATLAVNTAIAGLLTLVGGQGFGINLLYSQCIGLSICALILPVIRAPLPPGRRLALAALAVAGGSVAGTLLAWLISGAPAQSGLGRVVETVLVGLLFGAVVSGFFHLRERIARIEAELREERMRALAAEKGAVETELKLLQAQIEPHFLFNTLANVASLIDTSPREAGTLLEQTIRYLRATLARTRAGGGTLGQELEVVEAYLAILQMRLGGRLAWRDEVPNALRGAACPPLLLQPLVENAVKHGIEPCVAGGEVALSAERRDGLLRLTVADTGRGMSDAAPAGGVGLTNVRERLRALYGERGRLSLSPNAPRGVVATVEFPA